MAFLFFFIIWFLLKNVLCVLLDYLAFFINHTYLTYCFYKAYLLAIGKIDSLFFITFLLHCLSICCFLITLSMHNCLFINYLVRFKQLNFDSNIIPVRYPIWFLSKSYINTNQYKYKYASKTSKLLNFQTRKQRIHKRVTYKTTQCPTTYSIM